jgi:hypothetical protein
MTSDLQLYPNVQETHFPTKSTILESSNLKFFGEVRIREVRRQTLLELAS